MKCFSHGQIEERDNRHIGADRMSFIPYPLACLISEIGGEET